MANEFVIKNGFISKGDSIVSGSLSGETLNLTTTPSNDNSQTQVLVRNNTTGLVEYRDASTFSGASGSNTFVTGTTFGSNQSITRRNDGADVLILTGGTNVTLSNPSSNQIKIDVAVPSGDNFFSTAGTVTQSATTGDTAITLQIVGNSGFSPYSITGITDTFVNDFTFSSNTFTITQNDGSSFDSSLETIELGNILSAVTFNIGTSGSISATTFNGNTFSGGTYYGDGSNLTGISTDDNYVTGGTFSTNTLTLNRQNGSVTITGFTSDSNTFVTGTTFVSNEATLTRNDGTDVLFLTGGTNVTLSNPSSNQIKIDVSSSSSIDTGNVLWVDNIFGDDGTALVDRQDKPWSSIATAIGNAVANDTIMVRPGEYVEPDFTLVPSTSLVSQGGAKVTFIPQ